MRYLLPAALVAAMLLPGTGSAIAKPRHHAPRRATGHVSVHVSSHSVLSGHGLVVRGRVRPAGSHLVKVVVRGPSGGLGRVRSQRNGSFHLDWGLHHTGEYSVRAFAVHERRMTGAASSARRMTVYRPAAASYYGPGLYGGALACGGTLEPGTLGVAHKTLPCGTMVKLRYHGHTVTVPVVDRGPYVAGRDFDLTEATRARLHFPSTGMVLSSR